jgi:bacteriophage N4 adsorption protein B
MMSVDGLAIYLYVIKQLIAGLAFAIALSGLDDLLIDGAYLCRLAWRRLAVYSRFRKAAAEDLQTEPERPFAVMIPAWREADVIGQMIRSTLDRLDYGNYRLFVGVYPNDPETTAIIDALALADPRVVRADVAHPGGTSKGDCLNAIWRRIRLYELETGILFAGFVLHDAEDLVPAREMAVFNHLIGRKDMVQLPVLPLPQASSPWVAGHYLDEFAELHGKDLLVREWIGATVPCAGVACAFSRAAMIGAARANGGALFAAGSLTEDYELAHRIRALGFSSIFVRMADLHGSQATLATREYFPDAFFGAVRQKARWLAGITLQGWEHIGWRGSLAERYMLLRDRKALVTAWVNMLAYVAALHLIALQIAADWFPSLPRFATLVTEGSTTETLLMINAALLSWRLMIRALFSGRHYGWWQGLLSVPRSVVGNAINFAAACRAIGLYTQAKLRRGTMRWEKTAHRFPDASQAGRA